MWTLLAYLEYHLKSDKFSSAGPNSMRKRGITAIGYLKWKHNTGSLIHCVLFRYRSLHHWLRAFWKFTDNVKKCPPICPILAGFGHAQRRDPKGWTNRSIFDVLYTLRAFQNGPCCRPVTNWDGAVTLVNIASCAYPKLAVIWSARKMPNSNQETWAANVPGFQRVATSAVHGRGGIAGSLFYKKWNGLKVALGVSWTESTLISRFNRKIIPNIISCSRQKSIDQHLGHGEV